MRWHSTAGLHASLKPNKLFETPDGIKIPAETPKCKEVLAEYPEGCLVIQHWDES